MTEILRILSFHELAYYEILGVDDYANSNEIRQAFVQKAVLIQNGSHRFARQAFQRKSRGFLV